MPVQTMAKQCIYSYKSAAQAETRKTLAAEAAGKDKAPSADRVAAD